MPYASAEHCSWSHRKAIAAANKIKHDQAKALLQDAEDALGKALLDISAQTGVSIGCLMANIIMQSHSGGSILQTQQGLWLLRRQRIALVQQESVILAQEKLAELKGDTAACAAAEAHLAPTQERRQLGLQINWKGRQQDTCKTADLFHQQGWLLLTLQNPSEVSNMADLQKIQGALDSGQCFFWTMLPEELQCRNAEREKEAEEKHHTAEVRKALTKPRAPASRKQPFPELDAEQHAAKSIIGPVVQCPAGSNSSMPSSQIQQTPSFLNAAMFPVPLPNPTSAAAQPCPAFPPPTKRMWTMPNAAMTAAQVLSVPKTSVNHLPFHDIMNTQQGINVAVLHNGLFFFAQQ
ncbi:hypothetical protein DACRYDRAFT_17725 [Dacryopinax primogenitus]|uniref:Uncharacterized protein n=1 Tax=Dacryopinax primogenitus (strain DJM 731) TaxID=1858805 RepID=M5FSY1_DACPD|nr:uncharacterized protein DACRYDRAFT_17725 [Dacryopinax primogenitus]EJT99073.1 hypothetical protein DACRYDRAFT_17725 [Dacryopinax primogenitus]